MVSSMYAHPWEWEFIKLTALCGNLAKLQN